MFVARHGRRHRAGRAKLTAASSSSSMYSQDSSRFGAPEAQLLWRPSLRPPNASSSVRLLNSPRYRTQRRERRPARGVSLPLLSLLVRLRLHASVSSALLPGRDAHSPSAPRELGVLGVRAACLSASYRQPPVLPGARAPALHSALRAATRLRCCCCCCCCGCCCGCCCCGSVAAAVALLPVQWRPARAKAADS
jgi:hypothetical protein